jgi:hypothetical protein
MATGYVFQCIRSTVRHVYHRRLNIKVHFATVMPMEISVTCVGDLATLGVSLVVVTPVCSPPGSFLALWPSGVPGEVVM